jgi:toxin ParE1/3/4
MRAIRFLPGAEEELLAEVAFYSSARKGLGVKFQSAVELTVAGAL